MEKIDITGLNVDTLIGVYEWERQRPTRLLLDISLSADLSRAMASDDVNDTIDYARVAGEVQSLAKDSQFELLEAFGAKVMDMLLSQFEIKSVALTVHKPGILPDAANVSVTMKKTR